MNGRGGIEERVAWILSDKLGLEGITPEVDLIDTGLLDSMSFVELLFQMEREFQVRAELADLELDHFRSIARISEFIARRQPGAAGGA
jgi:methoxymalonate biosynthesis acyl carrier protein